MKITSDGVDKLIKQYEKDKVVLINEIKNRSTYVAAITENAEELRPQFDFCQTVKKIEAIENKILDLRHARNQFNGSTVLPGVNLTIDRALIRMAMINSQIKMFEGLANRMPKQRENNGYSSSKEIEYSYINYNMEDAKKKVSDLTDELTSIKKELNLANSTLTFDVPDMD